MNSFIKSTKYSKIFRKEFKYLTMLHDDWTLYIVIDGIFCSKFNNQEEMLQKGDLYIIPPFVKIERHVIEPITVHFIRFELDDTVQPPFEIPTGKINLDDEARLESTLKMFRDLSKIPYQDHETYLTHLLFDILFQYHYERRFKNGAQTAVITDPIVADVVKYLKQNYAKKLYMKDIAAEFGISPSGLILKFRRATGMLPMRHLISIRISYAKRLLVDTSLSLAEIAAATGFENEYYFSTAFKKEAGLSPSKYRKMYMI